MKKKILLKIVKDSNDKIFEVYYIQKSIDTNKYPELSVKFTRFIVITKSPLYSGWCISAINTSP